MPPLGRPSAEPAGGWRPNVSPRGRLVPRPACEPGRREAPAVGKPWGRLGGLAPLLLPRRGEGPEIDPNACSRTGKRQGSGCPWGTLKGSGSSVGGGF